MPHFLCKLRPPRTTFISDMTPDEAQLMRAHREYWTPRVETGVVIAMGPVADPAGGYGVAIIEAASEAALEAMKEPIQSLRPGVVLLTKTAPCWGSRCAPASRSRPSLPSLPNDKKGASRRDRNGD